MTELNDFFLVEIGDETHPNRIVDRVENVRPGAAVKMIPNEYRRSCLCDPKGFEWNFKQDWTEM